MPRTPQRELELRDRAAAQVAKENARLRAGMEELKRIHEELHETIDKITRTPWHPALLVRVVEQPDGTRALVWIGGTQRLVDFYAEVDPASLCRGDAVFLNDGRNLLMAAAQNDVPRAGDTALFERLTADGRLVIRARDEEIVIEAASQLDLGALSNGDRIRFDRAARLAFERLESEEGQRYLLEEVGVVSRSCVGGQDRTLEILIDLLTETLIEPELARLYALDDSGCILLNGPAGCGKTLMGRVAASEIQRISGEVCHFGVVRPGEFHSPYVGTTEANIRACFRSLRKSAGDGQAVLFLDEIDSIGRIRGGTGAHHADRFLGALLAEIDGFSERGRVAIIAATNRKDLLDPALLSRFSQVCDVPRPDLQGARQIFDVHFGSSVPYAANGVAAAETRSEIVETAASRLYAPNGDAELCELQMQDGKRRTVHARELVSGRLIEQIAHDARRRARRRHSRGDARGVEVRDVRDAIDEALQRLATSLTVHNVRSHLDDLPQGIEVVRVEPIRRKPAQVTRYVDVA